MSATIEQTGDKSVIQEESAEPMSCREAVIPCEEVASTFSRQFPIHIIDTIGVAPEYQRLHRHDVLEINWIKSGSGHYLINGRRIDFQQGDILLINSNDLHRAYEKENLVMQVTSFDASWFMHDLRYDQDLLAPFTELGVHFTHLLNRDHSKLLQSILSEMQEEYNRCRRLHVSIVRSHLIRFLAYVNRYLRSEAPLPDAAASHAESVHDVKICSVIQVMEREFIRPWTLKELARLAYLSPSRFSAVFKQTVGVSPVEYLISIRIKHAVRLLESSNMQIIEIALECGFRNLSNFYRLFKSSTGYAPSEVRSGVFAKR